MTAWTAEEDARLALAYNTVDVGRLVEMFGRSKGALRNRASDLGISKSKAWAEADVAALKAVYANAKRKGDIDLKSLAVRFDRPVSAICAKAGKLGITDNSRKGEPKPRVSNRKYETNEQLSTARSETMRKRHRENAHPMLGKQHSPEVKEAVSIASKKFWATVSADQMSDINDKRIRSRVASQGSAAPNHKAGSWKAGWREIGGKRNYYRSRWEANYGRYLEWLKINGNIVDWRHEPETFWFDKIKRGVRSYLPDFRVWENDGTSALHEVKGWMDARSKTTLARMGRYHPNEKIILIREKDYNAIGRKVSGLIAGWEASGRSDRI